MYRRPLVKSLKQVSFPEMAGRVCALYNEEEDALLLGMLGQEYLIRREGVFVRGQKAPEAHAGIVLDYLFSSGIECAMTPWRTLGDFLGDPAPDIRRKVELPITSYATDILARANNLLPMVDAKTVPSLIGSDLAITVRALPKVYLHVELSQETQDFPAEAWMLFSNNANEFLTVTNLQILAEMFKDRLLSLLRIY
jgi:hypothetical protein